MPKFLWMPYVVVIVVAATVDLADYPNAAWILSVLGTVAVLMGHAIYAGVDSKQRWPDLTLSQRLGRIFTFQR